MMRIVGPWLARWKIGRKIDWLRFTYAKLRTPGTIIAAEVPHIDPPFTLRMSPGSTLKLGRNVHFRPGFVANITGNATLEIGNDVAFNVNCWVGVTSSIRIGDACLVGPFVSFTDGNHRFDQVGELVWHQGLDLRPLEIGRNVWFGAKATIINDVGDDAVVGANAVVTHPVPAGTVVVGVPARVQRTIDGQPRAAARGTPDVLRRRQPPAPATPGAALVTPAPAEPSEAKSRPTPPDGAADLVVVVLDSLRYDSWLAAAPKVLAKLGAVERRWSYASWTAPSHYNLLMGLLPHASPTHVYASQYYKQDFVRYADRLNVPGIEFKELLPSLFLPTYLRNSLGYRTNAMVSMPVLNRHTPINHDFDSYELMPTHNDMAAMVDRLDFSTDRPSFHLLNVGETHYPYALPDEDPSEWPRISGVHGVVKHLDDDGNAEGSADAPAFFDDDELASLRQRQIRAVRYLDGVFERLFDIVPSGTWVIVTSDHGELFGEGGYFGHGPIAHEKVYEVPFVEGRVR